MANPRDGIGTGISPLGVEAKLYLGGDHALGPNQSGKAATAALLSTNAISSRGRGFAS
jgi:hypothetical protein